MLRSKKIMLVCAVLLVSIGLTLIRLQTRPEERNGQDTKPIKVGVIVPLSGGDYAALEEEVGKGIEVASEEIEANEDLRFDTIVEDSQNFSPQAAVSAANKLVNVDRVDAALAMSIEESKLTAQMFNSNKTPLMVLWDATKFLKGAGEYIFSNGFSTERNGEVMAEYAYRTLGVRKVGIVSNLEPWGDIISESFQQKFKQLGGTVALKEALSVETDDYRTVVLKMKELKVDGIYFPLLLSSAYVNFLKNVKEQGLNVKLMTGDAFIQDAITKAANTAENVYLTDIFTEREQELSEKYQSKYKSEPVDVRFFSFGYDGIMKLKEALLLSRKNNQSLKDSLTAIFGPTRSADRVEKIYQVKNGKPVEVEQKMSLRVCEAISESRIRRLSCSLSLCPR